MSRQFTFAKDAALKFDDNFVSDHNRSPLQITVTRLEDTHRTQRGTMRTYFRADKHTISASWNKLPENSSHTVDVGWGAEDIRDFYLQTEGPFNVLLTYDTNETELMLMKFEDFSMTLVSRKNGYNLYDVSLSLEEI